MLVYQRDGAGLFVGVTEADESPLEPGVFLMPGGCVADAPPAFDDGQRARWVDEAWVIEPIPAPPPPDEPEAPSLDGPTLSDWRVALIQMGRFSEVKAAIESARDTGSVEGLIAWERFEYANHVYRAELLRLAPLMGFTEADIDESLIVAAQIAAAAS